VGLARVGIYITTSLRESPASWTGAISCSTPCRRLAAVGSAAEQLGWSLVALCRRFHPPGRRDGVSNEKRYTLPVVLSTEVVHNTQPKYSMPTPQLNKIKKRLPREKRKGWLRRLQDSKRGMVAGRKSSWNPIHQSRCHRSISVSFPITKAIRTGQELDDFKSFKIAMQDWALSDPRKFTFRFEKSDRTCNTVVCVHANTRCPFKVNATYSV